MAISILNQNQRSLLLIILVYSLANGLMLINNGVFWDDWTLFNMSEQGIREQFIGNGSWNSGWGYMHIWLQKTSNPPLLYHAITFLLHLGISLLFFTVLGKFDLDHIARLAISLIAATVPFNQARVTMICLPYSISLFLFMLAFLIFINNLKRKNILIRIISLSLFFYSFTTNSLLVFYAIVPLALMYFNRHQLKETWKKLIVANIDFLILPPLFWLIKSIFLKPQNFYFENGYNSFSFKRLIYSPIKIMSVTIDAFSGIVDALNQAIFSYYFLFSLAILAILYFFNFKFKGKIHAVKINNSAFILQTGIVLLILAILPYILVGKLPLHQGFETRHQLLMPFGYSLIIYGLLTRLIKAKFKGIVLILILLFNIAGQISLQKQYLIGWMKQESIMSNLLNHPEIHKYRTIQVIDQVPEQDATTRALRFYEWNGMVKKVFGHQDQLFVTEDLYNGDLKTMSLLEFVEARKEQNVLESRNMKKYFPDDTFGILWLSYGSNSLDTWKNIIKINYLYYEDKNRFNKEILEFTKIIFHSTDFDIYKK